MADDRVLDYDRYILAPTHEEQPPDDPDEDDDEPQGGDGDTDCRHCSGSELTGHAPDCIYSILGSANQHVEMLEEDLAASRARVAELELLLNTPHTADFLEAVKLEALHQRERWGVDHDAGKTDTDWFWLLGYLAGKALRAGQEGSLPRFRHVKRGTTYQVISIAENENQRGTQLVIYRGEDDGKVWSRPAEQFYDGRFEQLPAAPAEKLLHHIISSAAVLLNWHAARTGADTRMRPGIEPPKETAANG